jgi:two-component system chemotaxis response regulator CheB
MPVIMCSSLTLRGASVTLEALACGASDYVAKPAGQSNREAAVRALAQDLLPKIRALASSAQIKPQSNLIGAARPPLVVPTALPKPEPITSTPTALCIGVSTGGPAALDVLLPALPSGFPLPILIVQHMPEVFTKLFAERLNSHCRLRAREAAEGEPVSPGVIYIARGNWHMEVLPAARPGASPTLRLKQGPLENHCRPAADVLFRSAAAAYGSGVLAVVLTGMGSDGLSGCRIIRNHGGSVLAQDQATSTVWGMPGAVANAGLAHKVLALDAIAPEILRIVNRPNAPTREIPIRESLKSVVS